MTFSPTPCAAAVLCILKVIELEYMRICRKQIARHSARIIVIKEQNDVSYADSIK
jgi:aspartate 1-decarboxylase